MSEFYVINNIIASYKKKRKLTQDHAVARQLGVKPSALANYRKGKRRMPDKVIAHLADGLEVSLGDMVAVVNVALDRTDEAGREFWIGKIQDQTLKGLAMPTPVQ